MDLTVLGAGPAYSDQPGSIGAAYMVTADGRSLVLDLGQGSFPNLASRLEPSTIVGVVVSHLHPDHFVDLVPLRHYLRYQLDPPRRVRVVAPAGLAERLDGLNGEPGFTAAALDVEPLSDGSRQLGPFTLEARRVTHTADSYAFRVTASGDGGLVYSGDCGHAADLAPLVRPGDDLLVEVSFGPGPVAPGAQHLDAPAIAALAAATAPRRVLLTHLQMGYSPAATIAALRERWDGAVELVEPGYMTTVGE